MNLGLVWVHLFFGKGCTLFSFFGKLPLDRIHWKIPQAPGIADTRHNWRELLTQLGSQLRIVEAACAQVNEGHCGRCVTALELRPVSCS